MRTAPGFCYTGDISQKYHCKAAGVTWSVFYLLPRSAHSTPSSNTPRHPVPRPNIPLLKNWKLHYVERRGGAVAGRSGSLALCPRTLKET